MPTLPQPPFNNQLSDQEHASNLLHGDSERVWELSRKAKDLFFCPVSFAPGLETSHNTHMFKRRSKCEKTPSSNLEYSIFPAKNGVPQVAFALYQRKFNSTATALKIGMRNYGPGMIPVSAGGLSGSQLNYTELNAVALWCFFFPPPALLLVLCKLFQQPSPVKGL